jgi:DNA helicase-2/ATP-dependent DNA helicase PcrA
MATRTLRDAATAWAGQVGLVRAWYQPHLERLYDYAPSRAGDLDQLEQIAMGYPNRERFLPKRRSTRPTRLAPKPAAPCSTRII